MVLEGFALAVRGARDRGEGVRVPSRRFETEQRGHLVLDAVRARDGGDVCDIRRRYDDLSQRASRDARDVPKR